MEQLIHADSNRAEVGMITDFRQFDAQIHHNCELADNTYSLEMAVGAWQKEKIMRGDYIYIDGTEFGGIVSSVTKNTTNDTVTIKGPLWRALLAMRIIFPPEGTAYKVYSGIEANAMIADVIGTDYVSLFTVSDIDTETSIYHSFRYQTKLAGLSKALNKVGFTLSCIYDATIQRVRVQARRIVDYSDYSDISSDLGIGLSVGVGRVDDYNHIIGLGSGELENRMVRELWMQDGEIYRVRPAAISESKLRSLTFDYPNAESENELYSSMSDALLEYAAMSSASVDLTDFQLNLQLDDIITTIDRDLGITAKKSISQRVLTINRQGTVYRTEVE